MDDREFYYDETNRRLVVRNRSLRLFDTDNKTIEGGRTQKRSFFYVKDGELKLFAPTWDNLKPCRSTQSDLCLSCKRHHALPEKHGGCKILTEGQSLEYPFILRGAEQVRLGKTVRLYVMSCNRYEKEEERPDNPEERRNLFLYEEDMEIFNNSSSLFGTKHLL